MSRGLCGESVSMLSTWLSTLRRTAIVVVLVALGGTVPPSNAAGPNLLQNPGFEEGPRADCATIGLYWDGPQYGCQPSVQALDSSEKHSGSWSQRLGPSTQTDLGWIRQVTSYNSIQTGKTYRISAWIKSTVTDGWGWNVFRAEALENDTTLFHINMPQQESPDYDWRLISWEYTVTDPRVNRLGASLTRHWHNGYAWYDDVYIGEVTPGPPEIAVLPDGFTHRVIKGNDLLDDEFTVQNVGGGTLNYTITDNADWLEELPDEGTSTGEADTITIEYSVAALEVGTHNADITVADPAATNPLVTLPVTVTVGIPGDMDYDGDVDMEDFGRFQACCSGDGESQDDPDCADAKLDIDGDVDKEDLDLFLGCMSGPGVPGDPACVP